jgi:hypothetical protein
MSNTETQEKPEESAPTTQADILTAFVTAVQNGTSALNEYTTDQSAQVDKAQQWDDHLNPAVLPIRLLLDNLSKSVNGALLESPVIKDYDAALVALGQKGDFRDIVAKLANHANHLQSPDITSDVPDSVTAALKDIRGNLENSLTRLLLPQSVMEAAQAALDAYGTMVAKRDSYLKASKRTVPSATGTQGPGEKKEPKSDKEVAVTFVSENGLFTYSTKGARNGTKATQEVNKVGHAIKEKVAQARGFGQDVNQLPESDREAIMAALDIMADSPNVGEQRTVAGIGTFTRK